MRAHNSCDKIDVFPTENLLETLGFWKDRFDAGLGIRFISLRSRIPLLEFFMANMEYHVPKMVGRDKELDQLKEFLHVAINGKGNTVFVSGEAGIGKTRLVKELEAYAESLGVKVLEGRCLYECPTPFLPFREALRNVFQVSKADALPLQERKIKKVIFKFISLLILK